MRAERKYRLFYANEKLSNSMRILAESPGDVRSRLLKAFMQFHPLKEEDFPPKLRRHYRWITKQLTKRGPVYNHRGEVWIGSVENTLRHVRNSTGSRIAERLLRLH